MRTPALRGLLLTPILFSIFFVTSAVYADVADVNWELNRQQGFGEHEKENEEFNKERLAGANDMKKDRADWDKKQADAVRGYKVWKEHEGKTPDENSPEYREDQKERAEDRVTREKARTQYEKLESRNRQELQRIHPLKECKEFKLCDYELGDKQFEALRVPQKDRLLYGNKPAFMNQDMAKAAGGLGRGGSDSFSRGAGDMISNPPPATPSGPEFYEPEVPPAPPPPIMPEGGGFEDQIPPPIFDEPGY